MATILAGRTLTMVSPLPRKPTMAERIESALVMLAYFIELDGEVHVPLYERMEAELERVARVEGTKARARRLLSQYGQAVTIKEISSQSLNETGLHKYEIG